MTLKGDLDMGFEWLFQIPSFLSFFFFPLQPFPDKFNGMLRAIVMQGSLLVDFQTSDNGYSSSLSTHGYNEEFIVGSMMVSYPGSVAKQHPNHYISIIMFWYQIFPSEMLSLVLPNTSSDTMDK